eukprot:12510019-Alexandrium_andersonii.AAC.1
MVSTLREWAFRDPPISGCLGHSEFGGIGQHSAHHELREQQFPSSAARRPHRSLRLASELGSAHDFGSPA